METHKTAGGVDRSRDISNPLESLHPDERLKHESRHLRGTILESLDRAVTGAVSESDAKLLKFHGIYQQDDRDIRDERRRQKLEPDYGFMVRIRMPGGVCSPAQLLGLIETSRRCADGALRLTTRQTIQLHRVRKRQLKPLIKSLDEVGLDTIAACGDDTRGVMCAVNPGQSGLHAEVYSAVRQISDRFIPKTGAYEEIWLDREPCAVTGEEEPLYGRTYLPRKFKIGVAVPPVNDIDVYSQDLGFIAIADKGGLKGYNVTVGGGMGHTDSDPATYPRTGDVIGYIDKDRIFEVIEATIRIQRDFGNRVDRARARFKYTIDDKGIDWFVEALEERTGISLKQASPYSFKHNGDQTGWINGQGGVRHYCLFIENGRITDTDDRRLLTALRELALLHQGEFRLTPNQNIVIAGIRPGDAGAIEAVLLKHGLDGSSASMLRENSIACVALPTCGLAMAESERYLPSLVTRLERIVDRNGLSDVPISIRMSGCPNGCSRPYLSEIGLTGKAPGRYNLYLGGARDGSRLNRLYLENAGEAGIIEALEPILGDYAKSRRAGESFGDFVIRRKYISPVTSGADFKSKPTQRSNP